jgi:hypothetical protein
MQLLAIVWPIICFFLVFGAGWICERVFRAICRGVENVAWLINKRFGLTRMGRRVRDRERAST